MAADKAPAMWVPTCCNRIMRYNTFKQPDGTSYGALVCTVCSKNITLEQEPLDAVNTFGDGASVLSVLGSPRPPKVDRKRNREKAFDPSGDEPTL